MRRDYMRNRLDKAKYRNYNAMLLTAKEPTMKSIAGAILILAAAIYGVGGIFVCFIAPHTSGMLLAYVCGFVCGFFWLVHFIAGFLLMTSPNEPPSENLEGRLSFDTKRTFPDEQA